MANIDFSFYVILAILQNNCYYLNFKDRKPEAEKLIHILINAPKFEDINK